MFKKLIIIPALLALLAGVSQADTIITRGETLSGVKIVSESYKEVVYTLKGKKATIAAGEVLAVIYDRPPVNFRIGVERYSLGDYVNSAARLALAVDEGADDQPWVKEYSLYYLGKAQLGAGQYAEAAKALEKMLKLKADSRLYPSATIALARAKSLAGDHGSADDLLRKLGGVLDQNKVGGGWVERAKLARAEAKMAGKSYDPAAELCKEVFTALQSSDKAFEYELAMHAKSVQLQAHLLNGDTPKANFVIDDLRKAQQSGKAAAQAAYRNARAAMVLAEGEPSDGDLMEAAQNLARVRAENFTVVSELPRTCYLLGLIHLKLDGSLAKAKELAKGYFEETRRLYPESREAFLAREELKKM